MPQKETVSEIKSKVHWFILPLLVAIIGWLMISEYEGKARDNTIIARLDAGSQADEKMWNMLVSNHAMLENKADQKVNEADHQRIINKLDELEGVVGKTYGKIKKYSETRMYPDTIFNVTLLIDTNLLHKQQTFLTTKSNMSWNKN